VDGDLGEKNLDYEYDKIIIACGAIASCALLQRSDLISKVITLKDTQVFYSAFYMLENKSESTKTLELAQVFIRKSKQFRISDSKSLFSMNGCITHFPINVFTVSIEII
jgi:hypothetical protein